MHRFKKIFISCYQNICLCKNCSSEYCSVINISYTVFRCIFQIGEKKWEGSYSPKQANGKRKKFNIYADSKEECEEKLVVMIAEKNSEIAAEKERLKVGLTA